jgi:hypothetical protein
LIDKVKIGVSDYDVQLVESVSKDELLLGQIDYQNLSIRVDKDYPILTQKITLLHEIVHGLFHELSEDELRGNEKLVDQLARLLYQVIRDNPKLIELVREE